METHLDNLESGYRVQVGEVKGICHKLSEMERAIGGKLVEFCNAIVDMRRVHRE